MLLQLQRSLRQPHPQLYRALRQRLLPPLHQMPFLTAHLQCSQALSQPCPHQFATPKPKGLTLGANLGIPLNLSLPAELACLFYHFGYSSKRQQKHAETKWYGADGGGRRCK